MAQTFRNNESNRFEIKRGLRIGFLRLVFGPSQFGEIRARVSIAFISIHRMGRGLLSMIHGQIVISSSKQLTYV